jgi:hypothetical protein
MVRASNESPQFAPSAPLVRQVAEPIAKTLSGPKPDYSLCALPESEPEPDVELSRDNPFYETLQRFRRGDIPGREAAAEIVCTVTNSIAGNKRRAA